VAECPKHEGIVRDLDSRATYGFVWKLAGVTGFLLLALLGYAYTLDLQVSSARTDLEAGKATRKAQFDAIGIEFTDVKALIKENNKLLTDHILSTRASTSATVGINNTAAITRTDKTGG
jgi:hypothetical protein